jgi:hypothetical protein
MHTYEEIALKSYPTKQLTNNRYTYHNTIQFKRVQWTLDICWPPDLQFLIPITHYLAPIFLYLWLSCIFGHHYLSDTSHPVTLLQTLWQSYLPILCLTLLRWKVTCPARSELICILYFYSNKIIVKLAFIGVHLPTKISCVLMFMTSPKQIIFITCKSIALYLLHVQMTN